MADKKLIIGVAGAVAVAVVGAFTLLGGESTPAYATDVVTGEGVSTEDLIVVEVTELSEEDREDLRQSGWGR